jgi:hypothetical protein
MQRVCQREEKRLQVMKLPQKIPIQRSYQKVKNQGRLNPDLKFSLLTPISLAKRINQQLRQKNNEDDQKNKQNFIRRLENSKNQKTTSVYSSTEKK